MQKQVFPSYELILDYENYLQEKKLLASRKIVFDYKDTKLGFTEKQIEVLKLIAKGFSNIKIAKKLKIRESAVKLLVYRLMKYLETILSESIDRYSLIIIAQELDLDQEITNHRCTVTNVDAL